jgi:hypothetical protein
MSGPRGHLRPGTRNRPPNPPRTVPGLSDRQPTAEPSPALVRRDRPPPDPPDLTRCAPPNPGNTSAGPPPSPTAPTAQLTTTPVCPQVPPPSSSAHTMDHPLDLEWTVVDDVDVALAGMDSPDPSPAAQPSAPRPAPPTGSSNEEPQETTTNSHTTVEDTAPTRTPAPDMPEDVCDGVDYEEWGEDNPYGRGPQATRLPRPESLCWRCGVPGHSRGDCRAPVVLFCSRCGTMGLMSRDCPCPKPPAAPLPRAAGPPCRDTPNPPERSAIPERAPCPLCGHRRRQRRRHRR